MMISCRFSSSVEVNDARGDRPPTSFEPLSTGQAASPKAGEKDSMTLQSPREPPSCRFGPHAVSAFQACNSGCRCRCLMPRQRLVSSLVAEAGHGISWRPSPLLSHWNPVHAQFSRGEAPQVADLSGAQLGGSSTWMHPRTSSTHCCLLPPPETTRSRATLDTSRFFW